MNNVLEKLDGLIGNHPILSRLCILYVFIPLLIQIKEAVYFWGVIIYLSILVFFPLLLQKCKSLRDNKLTVAILSFLFELLLFVLLVDFTVKQILSDLNEESYILNVIANFGGGIFIDLLFGIIMFFMIIIHFCYFYKRCVEIKKDYKK